MNKIAIHNSEHDFHPRWVRYCEERNIPYKRVDCYADDIMAQLADCHALMWHIHQSNPKDIIMARQLLFALQQAGKKVFPDFNTAWHFDDKLGQKYLLEALKIENFAPTWVFYDREKALAWAATASFPKVFKLRGGAGSQNVKLTETREEAKTIINKAFGKGFANYDAVGSLWERWRKYRLGKTTLFDVLKGAVRLIYPPAYTRVLGRELGYVYFQEFYPGNDSDTRIIVVGDKAFALKRMVRQNDFRASGSGLFKYEREEFDVHCLELAFRLTKKLNAQCVAFDFVFDNNGNPMLIEISFGFAANVYDPCAGYWDKELNWFPGTFDPYGWMVDLMQDDTRKVRA